MKREIPAWRERNCLQRALPEEGPPMPGESTTVSALDLAGVLDALNKADWKDARQRAEIRDLKKRLKIARGWEFCGIWIPPDGWPDALDLKKPLKPNGKAKR